MIRNEYSIEVDSQSKVVEVTFASAITLDMVENVLNQLKKYVAENYQIKMAGYINREYKYLRAFTLALSLFGNENRIIFENKAKFRRAERRRVREQMQELRDKGYSARQISEKLNVPLKTIYRWLKE
ncbi:MAG: helix-turn-helix domain-containing protein [Candidatus Bathyarchaeota archaeon]|nr:helix-turn-helix domain-containing protein [Candidatus Bathyarchaeota archaeon]